MLLKQLSVFLENKPGTLSEVTKVLKENNINIRALSMADTADFGILRIIVPEVDKVYQILKSKKFTVKSTEVVAVKVADKPGGLNSIIELFNNENINIEYMYAFVNKIEDRLDPVIIFKVHNIQSAINILVKNDVDIVKTSDILWN